MKPIITYDDVEEQFEQAEEQLNTTISGVDIYIARDVHNESLELTIGIFGEDGIEATPVVSEEFYDPEVYLGRGFNQSPVCPRCLIQLFEDKLLNLLVSKQLTVTFNRDWITESIIDPVDLHNPSTKLQVENR